MQKSEAKIMTEMKTSVRILVVTNDSTVFRSKGVDSAFNMFGGRVTEVKSLVARLDTAVDEKGRKLCDVSYGVITTRYGFVPGNYVIDSYPRVMSNREEYEFIDEHKNFVEQVSYLTRPFDKVVMCIPKDMFAMFLERGDIWDGKLIAVTSPDFKEECERRGWSFLERKGARVGNENADEIERIVRELCAARKARRSEHRFLVLYEPLLEGLPSGVAADPSRGRDHPVAGDYYRQRVGGARRPHRAVGFRGPYALRYLLVCAGLAVRYPLELFQDRSAEPGDPVVQGQVELAPLAAQILVHLIERFGDDLGFGDIHLGQVRVRKIHPRQVSVPVLADAYGSDQRHFRIDASILHMRRHM